MTRAYTTINTGSIQAKNQATVYVKLKPRAERKRNQAQLTQPLRERLQRIAGIEVTHVGVLNPVAAQKLLVISLQGQDLKQQFYTRKSCADACTVGCVRTGKS